MSPTRRSRLIQLGMILAVAAVVVVIAIVSSGGGDDDKAASTGAVRPAAVDVAGVPQKGITLGDPKARVTIVEFADLQCPFCRDFALETLPRVVRDLVRTGKAKMQFRSLAFIGPDSVTSARLAAGVTAQDRLWEFIDLFYANQGKENSGYATTAFTDRLLRAIPGLDAARAKADAGRRGNRAIQEATALAQRYGVQSTPTLLVGPTGGTLRKLDGVEYATIRSAVEGAA